MMAGEVRLRANVLCLSSTQYLPLKLTKARRVMNLKRFILK